MSQFDYEVQSCVVLDFYQLYLVIDIWNIQIQNQLFQNLQFVVFQGLVSNEYSPSILTNKPLISIILKIANFKYTKTLINSLVTLFKYNIIITRNMNNQVLLDKREILRNTIRNKYKQQQRQSIRSKFLTQLKNNPIFEISCFEFKLNKLANSVRLQSFQEADQLIIDIHYHKQLFQNPQIIIQARKINIISILIERIQNQTFNLKLSNLVFDILEDMSKYGAMADYFYPYIDLIVQILQRGYIDYMGCILTNLLQSDISFQILKKLIKNKIQSVIVSQLKFSHSLELWIKFISLYIQKLSYLKMQPNYQATHGILSYIKTQYINCSLPHHLQGQIQMFISVSNYEFSDVVQNRQFLRKLIKKRSQKSFEALQYLVSRESWIIESLVSLIGVNSPIQTVNLAVQTLRIMLQRVQDNSIWEYILSKMDNPSIEYISNHPQYSCCGLDQLLKSIRKRQFLDKKCMEGEMAVANTGIQELDIQYSEE